MMEGGLLGSLAYVKQHFGTVEDPKPEFASATGGTDRTSFNNAGLGVWYLANLDQMIPRFTKDKMPTPVPVR